MTTHFELKYKMCHNKNNSQILPQYIKQIGDPGPLKFLFMFLLSSKFYAIHFFVNLGVVN